MNPHTDRPANQDLGTTRSGIEPSIAGALSYLVGFITGILFFILEKDNPFVRFHALQSILVFGGWFVATLILKMIPFLGFALNFILSLCVFVIWLLCMIKASQGIVFKLPVVGDIAERNI